jgi:cyclic pyranopterin phosphate synthase
MTGGLSHVTGSGDAHMVDVSAKPVTARTATACGRISVNAQALAAIAEGSVAKGDVLATARIAGIMAAKRTADLIPLCHPLPLSGVSVEIAADATGLDVVATVRTSAQTGVEMEAITAATVALLTLYDMLKALDKTMVIDHVRITEKRGGKSGDWPKEPDAS